MWLFLVMCSAVFAGTTGKIAGRVTDAESGDPIIGAAVQVEGTSLGAAADLNGDFFILNVSPGDVTVRVTAIGYAPKTVEGLRVITDQTTTINFALGVEAITTGEVVITAERKLIESDRTFATSTVGSSDIQALPVTNLSQVVEIQAGVVDGHFRGGRSSEVMYLVDGISVTDAYDNSQGTQVDDGVVQELQVISGTFNAEYGQAMSGVVNIVTKEGAPEYHGTASSEFGDYISSHKSTWMNIEDVSPLDIQDYNLTLYGPVPFIDKLSFYGSFRYLDDNGWLYGQRRWDIRPETVTDTTTLFNLPRGDDSYASMNPNLERWGNLKLTYPLTDQIKLNYSTFYSGRAYRDYSHDWKYVPDGILRRYRDGRTNVLKLNHALNSAMFYELALTNTWSEYHHQLFDDPTDSRYLHPEYQDVNPPYTLNFAGTDLARFRRWTNSYQGTGNLSYQASKLHLLKFGFDVKAHELFYEDINLVPVETGQNQFRFSIEPISFPSHDLYTNNPYELAFYMQDKFELPSLIVNAGFRFDYFDPDGRLPKDPKDPNVYNPLRLESAAIPLEERLNNWYDKVDAKYRISPRLGIAYPMSDKGVFHFAYGHFVQRPTFERMYANPEYELESGVGLNTVMGNPDLDMEETVTYEFGFQQQIHEDVSLSTSLYFRDIRSLVATDRIVETYSSGTYYAQYVNRSFGEVKGITLSMDKRMANNFSAFVDYTYQIAEGNASDPQASYNDVKGARDPEQQLVPLDWDRRHTLNASLTYAIPGKRGWGATLLGKYGSGLPYSPTDDGVRTGFENDGRRPDYYNMDLSAFKSFPIGRQKIVLTLTAQNVLDIKNEDGVYDDTGRAGYTIIENDAVEFPAVNTLDEVYPDPSKFSRPRLVKLGVSYEF
ncbi:MAG: TonB-dependent receptor [Calditrichaeota bacterium]|nr:TonB-dependent receptor [Calditrichota bacterium]MCB9391800.1 TonB-dependent receptor [Calditrichota bacterium]